MEINQNEKIIYSITIGDLQNDAVERIGRELNDDELTSVKKSVEWGLSSIMDITFDAAIKHALDRNN